MNITAMQQARAQIEDVLRNAFGWGPRVYYAGSYGKDTMIAAYHDLDIVFYFPFGTNASLKTIYWDVYHALTAAGYILQQKDVAIRIPYSAGFSIDVVPGRAIDATFDYANLYRSETDSWLQTSIKQHIETIRNSNLRETMKLVKLWNVRHGLGVRSFALELLTIRALQGSQVYGHDSKLMAMFAFLRDHMATIRLVDPANTNNIITDAIPHATKKTVVFQAEKALTAQYWSDIVW
ncbi:MAG: nucleotidyltransferase [Chloroflexota bacterium]|nr:MAG: nucleotidyltransferase [Chloroflexota bacterium]